MTKKCRVIENIIKEAQSIMESCEAGDMCDAGIVLAEQKAELYGIETYGTLCFIAKMLGEFEAANLLLTTFDEKKLLMKTNLKLHNQLILKQKRR